MKPLRPLTRLDADKTLTRLHHSVIPALPAAFSVRRSYQLIPSHRPVSFFFLKSSCVFSNAARPCRTALHADDGHSECVSCLGKPQKPSVKGPSTPFSSGCSLLVSNTVVNTGPFPERMAHLSPVRGRANIPQVPLPQPLRVPGSQSKFCQELTFSQPTSFVPGSSFRLSPHEGDGRARTCTGHTTARIFFQNRSLSLSQDISKDAGPQYSLPAPHETP